MKQLKKASVRKLSTVVIIGLIMVFAPMNSALIMFIWSLFRKNEYPVVSVVDGPATVYLVTIPPENLHFLGLAIVVCGLVLLGYAGVRHYYRRR